jgi:ribose transport system substrate-binding protein
VLLGQKYFGWGSETVQLLYDIKHGKKPPSPIVDSGVDVVTKDNVDAYAATWKKMETGS